MNVPGYETQTNEAIDATREERELDWTHGPSEWPVYQGNLIYLPFAAHLAEEDAAKYEKAA